MDVFDKLAPNARLTTGYAISRQLDHASSTNAESVNHTLTEGSLSKPLRLCFRAAVQPHWNRWRGPDTGSSMDVGSKANGSKREANAD